MDWVRFPDREFSILFAPSNSTGSLVALVVPFLFLGFFLSNHELSRPSSFIEGIIRSGSAGVLELAWVVLFLLASDDLPNLCDRPIDLLLKLFGFEEALTAIWLLSSTSGPAYAVISPQADLLRAMSASSAAYGSCVDDPAYAKFEGCEDVVADIRGES